MRALFAAAGLIAFVSGCDDVAPLSGVPVPLIDASAARPHREFVHHFVDIPNGRPVVRGDVDVQLHTPYVPGSCGTQLVDAAGYIFDIKTHQGHVVFGASGGAFIEGDDGAFTAFDDQETWRVVSAGDSLFTLADETVVHFDATFARTLVASSDLNLVDLGFAGGRPVFTEEVPGALRTANGVLATADVAHNLAVIGDDIYFSQDVELTRVSADGTTSKAFQDFSFGPQRFHVDGAFIYMTTGLDGGVRRLDTTTGDVVVYDESATHWDADVDVDNGYVYWLERDFSTFEGPGRIMRAPVDGGASELITDCVAAPSVMHIHDGLIDVAVDGIDAASPGLVRFFEP